jgi:hypothetical protein
MAFKQHHVADCWIIACSVSQRRWLHHVVRVALGSRVNGATRALFDHSQFRCDIWFVINMLFLYVSSAPYNNICNASIV